MPLPALLRGKLLTTDSSLKHRGSWLARIFTPKAQGMPNPLTPETFHEFVFSHRITVVHFWAPWSDGNGLMGKLLASRIPGKLRQQAAFASFNIDLPEHLEFVREHKVFDVPLLVFYRDGALVRTSTGLPAPGVITKYLRELINPSATS